MSETRRGIAHISQTSSVPPLMSIDSFRLDVRVRVCVGNERCVDRKRMTASIDIYRGDTKMYTRLNMKNIRLSFDGQIIASTMMRHL